MKSLFKALLFTSLLFGGSSFAQTNGAGVVPKPATAITETPIPPANANAKPVVITLHNAAEKSVAVFAGPKEELKEPKLNVVGGLSRNTLYLKENDAVCLMSVDKRPVACTIIKPGITVVEVNVSANAISSK